MEILTQHAQRTKKNLVKKAKPEQNISSAINVQAWYDAVLSYDQGNIDTAIKKFKEVKQNSKMLVNIGCCYLRKSDLPSATDSFQMAVNLDSHLVIGFFLLGLTLYIQNKYEEALRNFNKAMSLLRGNRFVDYRQLGLSYQLYDCEILVNNAVVCAKLNRPDEAKNYLLQAFEKKVEKRHDRIFDCIQSLQMGQDFSPFIPPQSEIFRPPKASVKNVKKRDYLGTSMVISTDSMDDCYSCFSGIKDQVKAQKESEKPAEKPKNEVKTKEIRSALLTDIKVPNRRSTLRRISQPTPSKNILKALKDESEIRTRRYSMPPKSPLPTLAFEEEIDHEGEKTQEQTNTEGTAQNEEFQEHALHPRSKTVGAHWKKSVPCKPLPSLEVDLNNNVNKSNDKPRQQTWVQEIQSSPNEIDASDGSQQNSTNKRTPTPPTSENERTERSVPNDIQIKAIQPQTSDELSGEISVQVQYSFMKTINLPYSFSLRDLQEQVLQQCLLEEIQLRFTDEIGRQVVLKADQMNTFKKDLSKNNKILCFPK